MDYVRKCSSFNELLQNFYRALFLFLQSVFLILKLKKIKNPMRDPGLGFSLMTYFAQAPKLIRACRTQMLHSVIYSVDYLAEQATNHLSFLLVRLQKNKKLLLLLRVCFNCFRSGWLWDSFTPATLVHVLFSYYANNVAE